MTIAPSNALYALLIAAVLCLANEIVNAVRNRWSDFQTRRAIDRRLVGGDVPPGWSSRNVEAGRERLIEARDTRRKLEIEALDAHLAAKGQSRGPA